MKEVWEYFKSVYKSLAEFRKDWSELTTEDKAQLSAGVKNGTLTY